MNTCFEQIGRSPASLPGTNPDGGDRAAEVAVYDDVLARFGDAQRTALREQVAGALFDKAVTLRQTGDSAAATSTLERLLGLSHYDLATPLKSLFAETRIHLANMLLDFQEDFTRAETLYREAAPASGSRSAPPTVSIGCCGP
jgi:hypothetical protein